MDLEVTEQLNNMTAEVSALRREVELLHEWLNRQKDINSALYDMISIIRQKQESTAVTDVSFVDAAPQ
jgi:hypothetical protein